MNNQIRITAELVKKLIETQFPYWSDLDIKQVLPGGHDNITFKLGDNKSIRLPSNKCYENQVLIEQKHLPFLAKHLSIDIPTPIVMGIPTDTYPLHWSVYKWINGTSLNNIPKTEIDINLLALDLANFLKELHNIDSSKGPIPSQDNFYRGGDLKIYSDETQNAIKNLEGLIDTKIIKNIWDKALKSKWNHTPVWIHGDLAIGNILISDKRLSAIIDFGCMAIGDPACDLVIYWTFLTKEAKSILKNQINLDEDTWNRAKGWALWKSLITLDAIEDKNSNEAIEQKQFIDDIIKF